jgi:uncharacterized repeat protein (TIGR01451 family)
MWRRIALFPLVPLLAAGVVVAAHPASQPSIRAPRPGRSAGARLLRRGRDLRGSTALEQLPLEFVENRGQTDPRVAYSAVRGGTSFFFTSTGLTMARMEGRRARWSVKVGFRGAATVRPVGIDQAPGVISYFQGRQSAWHTGLPTFSAVAYRNLWPGIDLVYRGGTDGLEYSFLVHPGANPKAIRLAYRGVTGSSVGPDGGLHLATPAGDLVDRAPLAYQRIDGRRVAVASTYRLTGTRPAPTAGFSLGAYDRSRTLVIDPFLIYSGFIGGIGTDLAFGGAVDDQGNAYVVGFTNSTEKTFPEKVGPDVTENDAGHSFDAFIAKVNPAGTALVYCGYIGGSGDDEAYDVAVDTKGAAYVTGVASSSEATFPVKIGPDLTNGAGNLSDARDAFIAKVDPGGTSLDYAGFIGGNAEDSGLAVAVDSSGDAFVQGDTESSTKEGFPAVVGPDLTYGGSGDAFVGEVRADGTGFDYLGYIGGGDLDGPGGIAVDSSGNAYAVGFTWSDAGEGFPLLGGGDATLAGFGDAYVSKVNTTGSAFVYSEYIGGTGTAIEDVAASVAVDGAGDAFVAGRTDASDFPTVVGPDLTYNGNEDVFVSEVNPAGNGFVYSGFIGGGNDDAANGIALDAKGNAYVAGETSSDQTTFPVKLLPDLTFNGNQDAFVSEVASGGASLVYSGYVGGSGNDEALDNAVAPKGGRQLIVGRTDSGTFPHVNGPDLTFNGNGPPLGFDAFVSKVFASFDANLAISKTGPSNAVVNQTFSYTITVTNFGAAKATGVKVADTLPSQVQFVSASASQGTCSVSGAQLFCTVGMMTAGQVVTIGVQVQATSGGTAVNTAQVSSTSVDPFTGNNKSSVTTSITS